MFIGEYTHSIDEKGRLAIPSRFRRDLLGGAVITRGIDSCLFVYTKAEWQKLAEKLATLPLADPKARAFARFMLAGAMDVDFDKQGRALLPQYLRDYAGIKGDAVIAGLYTRLEIWEEKAWNTYKSRVDKETASIEAHLANLGI